MTEYDRTEMAATTRADGSRAPAAVLAAVIGTLALLAGGCSRMDSEDAEPADRETAVASVAWEPASDPSGPELDRARMDTSWRTAPSIDALYRDTAFRSAEDSLPYRPPPLEEYEGGETFADLARRARSLRSASSPDSVSSPGADSASTAEPDAGADILAEVTLPLGGSAEGPAVMYTQILLDRALFTAGAIDAKWGKNTEQAVLWFQRSRGLQPTGRVDSTTLARLYDEAGRPARFETAHVLTSADVSGEFRELPSDVYQQDDLDCLCYTSVAEKLAEDAHTTTEVLAELNPDLDLSAVVAGDTVVFPVAGKFGERIEPDGVRAIADAGETRRLNGSNGSGASSTGATNGSASASPALESGIAELVISGAGRYLHALDADGNVLFHFPATLGAKYSPSPNETLEITGIHPDPPFHWQPDLLAGVPDDEPPTTLPPGPNSPVGVLWMQLSQEHYGIHGTAAPATIGHANSSGCIRLTNWDVMFLAERVAPGVKVSFVDIEGR